MRRLPVNYCGLDLMADMLTSREFDRLGAAGFAALPGALSQVLTASRMFKWQLRRRLAKLPLRHLCQIRAEVLKAQTAPEKFTAVDAIIPNEDTVLYPAFRRHRLEMLKAAERDKWEFYLAQLTAVVANALGGKASLKDCLLDFTRQSEREKVSAEDALREMAEGLGATVIDNRPEALNRD